MPRTFPDAVDVVVVGSGPTGAAYVRVLSERRPDLDLATFEVGPLLADPPGLHVKNIADPQERAAAQRRSESTWDDEASPGRFRRAGTFLLADGYRQDGEDGIPSLAMSSNVGGMGAHWTAACPRPGGAEVIDFVPDLPALLDEADRLLGVRTDAFDDAPYAGQIRTLLAQEFDATRPPGRGVQPMPLAVHRDVDGRVTWSGSDVVYGEVSRTNPRHSLFPEALVTRVLVEAGAAHGVVVRDLTDGTEHVVRAREVVVAADGVRTPQLLWASGIRPAALGRYLNDQPQILFAALLRDVSAGSPEPAAGPDGAGIVRSSGVSWVPYTDDEPFHGQVMQLDASPVPLDPDVAAPPGSIVGLGWFCAKDIQASDRLEFDDTASDQYGMPAITVHYTLTDLDRARLDAARASIRRAAEAIGTPLDPEPILLPAGASLHYQGAVRMGATDDGRSVCDAASRVWSVPGLRVAGNGVIPTSTACNPTLTSVALAVAGARDIAATLATRDGTNP